MMTEKYTLLRMKSELKGEWNDCVVKAIAVVLDIDYDEAHSLCRRYGRIRGEGVQRPVTHKIIRDKGFQLRRVQTTAKTVRALQRILPSTGTFIVHATRHALAVENGVIHDWSVDTLKRVQEVYEVIPPQSKRVVDNRIGGMYKTF